MSFIESSANRMSVMPMAIITIIMGVKWRLPSTTVDMFAPSYSVVNGRSFCAVRTRMLGS